jgi:hypothetical protein
MPGVDSSAEYRKTEKTQKYILHSKHNTYKLQIQYPDSACRCPRKLKMKTDVYIIANNEPDVYIMKKRHSYL